MGYDPEQFFSDRFQEFGMNIKSAGHRNKTDKENLDEYMNARKIITDNFGWFIKGARVIDIGVGNGFHIQTYMDAGCKIYSGTDITDVLFDDIRTEYPGCRLFKKDITEKMPIRNNVFHVVSMIDVTQHIVDDKKFETAMLNVKDLMDQVAMFIVTSHLKEDQLISEFERLRPMKAYTKEFPGYSFSEPIPFRDKYIFSIKKERT